MAYLGRRPISPDHPFGSPSIHIGQRRSPLQPDGKRARLMVSWGYEGHWLDLTAEQWFAIRCGEEVVIGGPGYVYENHPFEDTWIFNGGSDELVVLYSTPDGHDDGVAYNGTLSGATIEEFETLGQRRGGER